MWIRTQDKLGLFESKGVKIREHAFENGTKEYLVLGNDNLYNHLGTYKSEERAIEVLDEIQKLLIAMPRTEIPFNDIVYQMPEV